jgi:hypothetical protein
MDYIKRFNKFEMNENLNTVDKLISHINRYLSPDFKLVVENIPEEFINVGRNITNSTKAVVLYKVSDNEVYADWYYNEFNLKKLDDWCYRHSFIDRDQEPSLAYEFKDISQRIRLSLKEYSE